MKNTILALVLVMAGTSPAEMTAREIIEAQTRQHKLDNESTLMSVTLIDRKDFREIRTLRRMDKDRGGNLMNSLTVFDAPADIKGTALLTRENAGKDNDQWLYFPSQRRLQRIAQTRRNAYFMGTDFTYEDMDPEKTDDFAYTHLEPERIGDYDHFVIEAVPESKSAQKRSGYGSRKLWIRKDILFTVKIEFFDRNGILIKTQTNSELEQLKNSVWRANRSFMDNISKRHQTEITVTARDTETEIDWETFTDRHILTGRYMQ